MYLCYRILRRSITLRTYDIELVGVRRDDGTGRFCLPRAHYINVDPPRFLMYTPNKNSERGGLYRHSFIQNHTNLLSPRSSKKS